MEDPDSLERYGHWASWIAVSLIFHSVLLASFVGWEATRPSPEPEAEPIPVVLLKEKAPEPPLPEAKRPSFDFRKKPVTPRLRDRVELRPEESALVPPPPDAELTPSGSGGGLAIDAPRVSAFGNFTLAGEGGGSAGRGVGTGNAMGEVGSFQEYLASLRQAGLDVVFVMDSSGSMGWVLSAVRARIEDLSRAVRRLVPVTRFGIVAYRDRDDPGFVTRSHPLTLSASRLRRFLEGISATGGGDVPEAVDAGLQVALAESGWTEGARHVVIVVGDAPPHDEHMDRALSLAADFRRRGGVVTAVDVGFDANPRIAAAQLGTSVEKLTTLAPRGVLEEFQAIARAGGGDATTLEGEGEVIRQLGLLIFGREWAEEVRPLLSDL